MFSKKISAVIYFSMIFFMLLSNIASGFHNEIQNEAPKEMQNDAQIALGVRIAQEGDIPKNIPKTPAAAVQTELEDETITQNIRALVARDPAISSATVFIMTQDGIVTLGGVVNTEAQKRAIETFAQDMPGVVDVNSRITVQPPTSISLPPNETILVEPPATYPYTPNTYP